jgi:5-methylcytosine-specific restriction endonuclease McrA
VPDLNLKQVMDLFDVGYQHAVAIASRSGGKQQKGGWRVSEAQLLAYCARALKTLEAQIEEMEETTKPRVHSASKRRSGIGPARRSYLAGRDGDRCFYCLKSGIVLTVDHVIPVARGGRSTLDNLVLACTRCNSSKRDLLPMEAVAAGVLDRSVLDRLDARPRLRSKQ